MQSHVDIDDIFPEDLQPTEVAIRNDILGEEPKKLIEEYDPHEWMKTSEVAEFFRVDPGTVKRWSRTGKFDGIRTFETPGGHKRFNRSDIIKVVEAHEDKI